MPYFTIGDKMLMANGAYVVGNEPLIPETPILQFITDASYISPTLYPNSGILTWNLGDASSNVIANGLEHDYGNLLDKTVRVYQGTTSGANSINTINLAYDKVKPSLNLSNFSILQSVYLDYNQKLTSINFPETSIAFFIQAPNCSLGTLDLSPLTGLSSLNLLNNYPLSSASFPRSPKTITAFNVAVTNFTGTMDISGLTGLGGNISLYNNSKMTQIRFPESSTAVTHLYLQGSGIEGILDLTPFKKLGGNLYLSCTGKVTEFRNPSSGEIITGYYVHGNKMQALDVSSFSKLGGVFYATDCPSLNKIYHGPSSQNFSDYRIYNSDLIGTHDMSCLSGFGGMFSCYGNKKLNYIINPTTSRPFSAYVTNDCCLYQLDLTMLTGLGGQLQFSRNPLLTEIKFPATSQTITELGLYNAGITSLDVSSMTGLRGNMWMYSNPKLQSVRFPNISSRIYTFSLYDCSLNGTLDVSNLSGISDFFLIWNNQTLDELILPSTLNHQFIRFDASNCSLSQSSVDDILHKFRTFWDASLPVRDMTLNLSGGTNSSPTNGSLNTDYLTIKNIFDNSTAYNISIYIN
jgi:hypothetical protein